VPVSGIKLNSGIIFIFKSYLFNFTMKYFLLTASFLLLVLSCVKASDTITVKHTYQGKNIFIKNPSLKGSGSFCTIKVLVNDSTVLDTIATSAYEINLSYLRVNATAKIQIVHHRECKPLVMLPIICFPSRAFQFSSLNITEKEWGFTTKGEAKNETILVESFRNRTWVLVKELSCKGSALLNNYTFPAQNISGTNKVRIKHVNGDGYITYSKEIEYVFSE
jgi:hypothetical protein